jgi:peroxiredoxin
MIGRSICRLGTLLVLLALVVGFNCGRQCSAAPPTAAPPTAQSLLKSALEYLEAAKAVQVDAEASIDITPRGMAAKPSSTSTIRFQRPDKFSIVAEGNLLTAKLISDGEQVLSYMPMLGGYTLLPIDGDTPASELPGAAGFIDFVKSFDADQAFGEITKLLTGSAYIGTEKIGDVECHHCRFDLKSMSIGVWFEAGEQPLVRKIAADLTQPPPAPTGDSVPMRSAQIPWAVTFNNWNTDATLTDADFAITPPDDAAKVDSLMAGRGAGPSVHSLVGQPAPVFEVPGLDGTTVSLAEYLGKNVIVLDFWATWCGPCVQALPEVSAVTSSLKDRGVVFYAVNIREEEQVVVDFLKEQNLDVPVALDAAGEVASAYQVSGIPQSVIIGKDGKVQVVHVGFGANLKELLTGELEQLLDGKDLAAETLADASASSTDEAAPSDSKDSKEPSAD